jgi:ribosome maturation factor RimP
MNSDLAELTAEIKRRVDQIGFELVDVRRRGSKTRPVLEARIDRPDSTPGHGVSSQDCAFVSRSLEAWLDDTQLLGAKYVLEVSSPGIERPIRWPEHWRRFKGQDVQVKLAQLGRVRATIVDVLGDNRLVLRPVGRDDDVEVGLDEVKDATLAIDWGEGL